MSLHPRHERIWRLAGPAAQRFRRVRPLGRSGVLRIGGGLEPSGGESFSTSASAPKKSSRRPAHGDCRGRGWRCSTPCHIGMTGLPEFGEEIKINYPRAVGQEVRRGLSGTPAGPPQRRRSCSGSADRGRHEPFHLEGRRRDRDRLADPRGPSDREQEMTRVRDQRNREITFTLSRLKFTGVMGVASAPPRSTGTWSALATPSRFTPRDRDPRSHHRSRRSAVPAHPGLRRNRHDHARLKGPHPVAGYPKAVIAEATLSEVRKVGSFDIDKLLNELEAEPSNEDSAPKPPPGLLSPLAAEQSPSRCSP